MDGNRGGGRHIRQCATVIPAVFFIRVCNVEPGYRTTGAHVRLHTGTESKNCVETEPRSCLFNGFEEKHHRYPLLTSQIQEMIIIKEVYFQPREIRVIKR